MHARIIPGLGILRPCALLQCQAPCQHNFCLGCFNKWVAQGKKTCPTCRHAFPPKFAANPRINTLLASAIRMAKLGQRPASAKVAVVGLRLLLGCHWHTWMHTTHVKYQPQHACMHASSSSDKKQSWSAHGMPAAHQ